MAQDKIASIFKRGGQKAEYGASSAAGEGGGVDGADAEQQLEQHLEQLAVAWAAPKLKKGLAAAVWRPAVGAFEVIERGRQAFNGQGFTHNKKLYLNIEEAVYLLDRATTLLLIDSEVQQQQQQQQAQQRQVQPVVQQRLLSVQEALHMMAVLGVQHERLCVLSYLSRLGFTVRRHPACWQVPAQVPACSTWQVNPAWAHTDGLTPLSAAQAPVAIAAKEAAMATAAPVAAAAAAAAAVALPQRQHVSNGSQQHPHVSNGFEQQQQASSPTVEQAAKRRKVQDAAPEQQQQQGTPAAEAQPEPPQTRQWYGALPAWLHPQQQQQQQQEDVQEQQDNEVVVLAPLLGLQLQQQFPLLRPLQRYRDTAAGAVRSPPPQQQQQQQQQQQELHTPGTQRDCCAATTPHGGGRVSDVVFDVIVKHDASKFSYRQPPAPQFSIAMMHPGCNNLPRLDEVLDLSRTVAAAAAVPAPAAAVALPAAAPVSLAAVSAAATGGAAAQAAAVVSGSSSSSRVCYRAVKFGLPEEGDVGFCELVPLRLMDLLTNM